MHGKALGGRGQGKRRRCGKRAEKEVEMGAMCEHEPTVALSILTIKMALAAMPEAVKSISGAYDLH